jgi:hypothetical protein
MKHKAPQPGVFAFMCVHVAREGAPILYVSREASVGEQDSGWCFACGRAEHGDQDWLMVLLDRYFEADPSLNDLLAMPEGHQAERFRAEDGWQIEPLPPGLE